MVTLFTLLIGALTLLLITCIDIYILHVSFLDSLHLILHMELGTEKYIVIGTGIVGVMYAIIIDYRLRDEKH